MKRCLPIIDLHPYLESAPLQICKRDWVKPSGIGGGGKFVFNSCGILKLVGVCCCWCWLSFFVHYRLDSRVALIKDVICKVTELSI